ncbi:MAG: bifunctional DNA primase/polymerase [Nitrospiria bacterium]
MRLIESLNQERFDQSHRCKMISNVYIKTGFSLVPLNGKIPTVKDWTNLPKTTLEQALGYEKRGNFGIRTGPISGVAVLDVDPKTGGDESLEKLSLDLNGVPTVRTGSGGRHFYFAYPSEGLKNSAGKLGRGLDIRAEGGQVVAPPSIHPDTGKPYVWEINLNDSLPPFPQKILELLNKPTSKTEYQGKDSIGEGQRNDRLFKLACSLREKGLGQEAITAAIMAENKAKCNPPLPGAEVLKISQSAGKYQEGIDPLEQIKSWIGETKEGEGDIKIIESSLRRLKNLEYAQVRKPVSEKTGISLHFLDKEFEIKKPEEKKTAVAFPEVEPWDVPVDGEELLDEISKWIEKYIFLSSGDSCLIAAWVMATWLADSFRIAPILSILSPTKGSGKTSLLDLLNQIVCRPLKTSGVGITPANLFRLNESHQPVFLIDEAEKLQRADGAQDFIGLLNEGYRRGGRVYRCNSVTHEPETFDAFGFRAVAAIGNLWDTIIDRSIVVSMQRKPKGIKTARFFMREIEEEGQTLARKIARWTNDNKEAIEAVKDKTPLPEWLKDRSCDNYGALFAVGMAAGGNYLSKLLNIAKIRQEQTEETTGNSEILIKDIKSIFEEESRSEKLITSSLIDKLTQIDSSPWGDMRGGKLTATRLAQMLKPFKVKPIQWREGTCRHRGYLLKDFEDVFSRYIPSDPSEKPVTPVTPGQTDIGEHEKDKEIQGFQDHCHTVTPVTGKNGCPGEGTSFDFEVEEMP